MSQSLFLDHLLLGCKNLETGIDFVEAKTGVRAVFGGVHPGRGTQNAVLSIQDRCYLEIIAPDPKQKEVTWFRELPGLSEPRLIQWGLRTDNMDGLSQRLRDADIAFSDPKEGSRVRPNGQILRWRKMDLVNDRKGLLPFFIEWSGDTVHPAQDAPSDCRLEQFNVLSPDMDVINPLLELFGFDLRVQSGEKDQLIAKLTGPGGSCDLISTFENVKPRS